MSSIIDVTDPNPALRIAINVPMITLFVTIVSYWYFVVNSFDANNNRTYRLCGDQMPAADTCSTWYRSYTQSTGTVGPDTAGSEMVLIRGSLGGPV